MIVGLLLAGCGQEQPGGVDCDGVVVDNEANTHIATLTWTSEDAGTSTVTYTVDGESFTRTASAESATSHTATLIGLPSLTDVTWTATTAIADTEAVCEGTFTTRNMPSGLPQLEVTVNEAGQSSEQFMLGLAQEGDTTHPFILNRSGQWVWYLSLIHI